MLVYARAGNGDLSLHDQEMLMNIFKSRKFNHNHHEQEPLINVCEQEMLALPEGLVLPTYAHRWNAAIKAHLEDPDVQQKLEGHFHKGKTSLSL